MKIKNLDKYIKLYGEAYLFDVIGPKTKKRKFLTFNDFYEICMWKSERPKNLYLLNKKNIEKKSEEVFKKDFNEEDERQKIKILESLKGVGIPTASAILTVVYPDKYAVIDIRCLEILKAKYNKDKFVKKLGKSITINTWLNYIKLMREWAEENKITPRKLDMALFVMHKEWLKENNRNLY